MGKLVLVVGASGVGKDSLMQFAANRLAHEPCFNFVKRYITRPVESGGEDHHALTASEFEQMEQAGVFAFSWQAHGLSYGISKAIVEFIENGGVAVVNGSRYAMPIIAAVFPFVHIISIVADPTIIAQRLRGRGRESDDNIRQRLERQAPVFQSHTQRHTQSPTSVFEIDNSGSLEDAGLALVKQLQTISLSPPDESFHLSQTPREDETSEILSAPSPAR